MHGYLYYAEKFLVSLFNNIPCEPQIEKPLRYYQICAQTKILKRAKICQRFTFPVHNINKHGDKFL